MCHVQTAAATKHSKTVEAEWQQFMRMLAVRINVDLDPKQHVAVEVITMGQHKLRDAGLLRLARLFAAPYGRQVPLAQPAMLFEECLQNICELFKSAHPLIGGSDPKVRHDNDRACDMHATCTSCIYTSIHRHMRPDLPG